ncbi:MAG: phosphoglycerate dehydrogenase [Acidobacteriota bacterium]|nr:phosphoglycerate dehydrogenase [Acidobacteriota bacterium]
MTARQRVLVAEKVGASGIELLEEYFDVELGFDWDREQVRQRLPEFDGILIRSATRLDAALLAAGVRLRAIGRAGVGVDNVDVPEASKRGIVVANAPLSNVVTAAEHTMALLLALARNVPQADASLKAGRWDRAKYSGVELYEKTLGIVGFGRIGQLVAERARGFGMDVIAYDPVVSDERYHELGVERAAQPDDVYAVADFLTLHLPKTPETAGWLNAELLGKCKDGVRVLNVARGPLVVDEDLKAALDSGKVAGAALDVFQTEPITEHPLFGYANVIVTPHLGASTAEANDRAGLQAAEQLVAALTGGSVTTAVNVPAIPDADSEALTPFVPLARALGRIAASLDEEAAIETVRVEFLGGIAARDTRLLGLNVLMGVLAAKGAEELNEVNAPALAEQRGIATEDVKQPRVRDYTDMIRVTVTSSSHTASVAGTVIGNLHRPHLLEAWGQRFQVQLEEHLTMFRYHDRPGMLGRVGTLFGAHNVNIASSIVGRQPEGGDQEPFAAMVVTTDTAVPEALIKEIATSDGFVAGVTVTL